MQLSKRMQMLASLVTPGNRLADIGTDHGYLPIYLVQQGLIPSAIAMDVRKGPLERAKMHIQEAGLSAYIETRLSDGLWKLRQGEADTILIAGMGGPLMERILVERMDVVREVRELVLQPQSEITAFRRFLGAAGLEILQEEMVCEDGKYYPMMVVRPGQSYVMTEEACMFGPILIETTHPVLKEYLDWEKQQQEKLLNKLIQVDNDRTRDRIGQVKQKLDFIEQARSRYHAL